MRIRQLLGLVAPLVLALASSGVARAASITIDNGLDCTNSGNVIDDGTYWDDNVYVYDGISSPTGVCVVTGGEAQDLRVYDNSTITMSGGVVYFLDSYDSSTITLSGGEVAARLYAHGSSTVTMSDGWILMSLTAYDSSTVTMSGGMADWGLDAHGSSTVTMSGGWANFLKAYDSSTVTMSGGVVGNYLAAAGSSILNVVGGGFKINGNSVQFGNLTVLTGTLTGTLASGESLNNLFYQGGYGGWATGTIRLVPEPSTAGLVGFGLLGLLAAGRRRAA